MASNARFLINGHFVWSYANTAGSSAKDRRTKSYKRARQSILDDREDQATVDDEWSLWDACSSVIDVNEQMAELKDELATERAVNLSLEEEKSALQQVTKEQATALAAAGDKISSLQAQLRDLKRITNTEDSEDTHSLDDHKRLLETLPREFFRSKGRKPTYDLAASWLRLLFCVKNERDMATKVSVEDPFLRASL